MNSPSMEELQISTSPTLNHKPPLSTPDSKRLSPSPPVTPSSTISPQIAPYTPSGPEELAAPVPPPIVNVDETTRKFMVVVAIDFGTAFSGYAFCFTRDPSNIHVMRRWDGGDPGVINQKIPTALLLDPSGSFHSFGYSARDHYHDLEAQEAKKWFYFDKFKMSLYDSQQSGRKKDICKSTMIKSVSGREVNALKVFSLALRFFKEHALEELNDQSSTKCIVNEDIRWVITVPAIWKESAKQFMREAAYEAGLGTEDNPNQLLIALEPEAASIFCRRLRKMELVGEQTPSRLNSVLFPEQIAEVPERLQPATELHNGTRYMVVDCGGGTVDITVHEMDSEQGVLKEIYKASGGPYGSVAIDNSFEELLRNIFTSDFIDQYKIKRPAGWVDFMIAFEARKRNAAPNKHNPLNVSIPFSFFDYLKKTRSMEVPQCIRKFDDKEIKWSQEGMLRMSPEGMRRLFYPTTSKICEVVCDVISRLDNECNLVPNNSEDTEKEKLRNRPQFIFLVGGFAESRHLQHSLREACPSDVQLVIPQATSLCVLKGAVLFGLDPTIVRIRRPKVTYGVGVLNKYVEGKHDPKKKIEGKDGVAWCTDIFDPFVKSGQAIAHGELVTRSYTPAKATQRSIVVNVYACEAFSVQYITDPGVTRCGTLKIDLTELEPLTRNRVVTSPTGSLSKKRREIQLTMQFGDTEIKVCAFDVITKKVVKAEFDFLGE